MARITVEDCLEFERNRFSLVLLASRRAKALLSGRPPVTDTKGNKSVVTSLREIADGKVRFKYPVEESSTLAIPSEISVARETQLEEDKSKELVESTEDSAALIEPTNTH